MSNMKLIVGLGNVGHQYDNTRHNVGFWVIDRLVQHWNLTNSVNKLLGEIWELNIKDSKVLLVKPNTFMNLSGNCVQQLRHYYQIATEDILVIYDDVELDTGSYRVRLEGSSGGQNGIKDIIQKLNTNQIKRIKIGIGPRNRMDLSSFVLSQFTKSDCQILDSISTELIHEVKQFIDHCLVPKSFSINKK